MAKLTLKSFAWTDPDRLWLYRAVVVLTNRKLTPFREKVARHALLVDLEIYDDPRQYAFGSFSEDELQLLTILGEELHKSHSTNETFAITQASRDQGHRIKRAALTLRTHLERNGPAPSKLQLRRPLRGGLRNWRPIQNWILNRLSDRRRR